MADNKNNSLVNSSNGWSNALTAIGDALMPRALKALDRLIGAGVDIPAAWLERHAENIKSKTKSQGIVERAVAEKAGLLAASDSEIGDRAMNNLLRKEYRRTENKDRVASVTIETLRLSADGPPTENSVEQLDEDWLNIFERFAEDASTERMQGLWGRVLAGEIRTPGIFSLRTLRFLSEFSQSDAVLFAEICEFAVGTTILRTLAVPEEVKDIRHLIQLESAGLVTGASGLGLTFKLTFDATGHVVLKEGNLGLVLRGEPNAFIELNVIVLTPLGAEVMSLIPDRDRQSVMRKFAQELRSPQIKAAFIGHQISPQTYNFIEQLWLDETPPSPVS